MLLELLLLSIQLLVGECQLQHVDGISDQKVAVSTASVNTNISCSLNLNLGDNCLEKDEIKVEMKGVVEELLQQESENLADSIKDMIKNITESLLQQLKNDLSMEMRETIEKMEVRINNSLNEIITSHIPENHTCESDGDEKGSDPITKPVGSLENPAFSCKSLPEGSPSGQYWVQWNATSQRTNVYCDMTRKCGNESGWMRVAYLNMKNSTHQCPTGFRQRSSPKRVCGRQSGPGCASTTLSVNGVRYSKVCGQIKAYQDGTPDAFNPYYLRRASTIDSYYVDGVSLTHGRSPRRHIWTFAAAVDEVHGNDYVCPCTRPDLGFTGTVPPFIGQDYFCETGSRDRYQYIFYEQDPLWDGSGCGSQSTCCRFNNPPWFYKQLPQPTTDDIELRLCSDQGVTNEDAPIEMFEIYVQ